MENADLTEGGKILRRVTILFVAVVALMTAFFVAPQVLLTQEIDVTITKVDAPSTCRKRSSVLFGPRQRSTKPIESVLFCGHISTDYGNLFLPESSRFTLPKRSREYLSSAIQIGCSYRIIVTGYGPNISKGSGFSNQGKRLIKTVGPKISC